MAQRQNAHVGARAVPCGSKGVPRGYRLRMKPRCVYLQRLWLPRGAHIERLAPAPTQRIKILVGDGHFLWLPLKAYRRPSATAGARSIFFSFLYLPRCCLVRPVTTGGASQMQYDHRVPAVLHAGPASVVLSCYILCCVETERDIFFHS